MKTKNRDGLTAYQFDDLPWAPVGCGPEPELLDEWGNRLQALLEEGEKAEFEGTIDPGQPPTYWSPIVGLRLGHIYPFEEEVPIVRMRGHGGFQDQALQHLRGFRPKE